MRHLIHFFLMIAPCLLWAQTASVTGRLTANERPLEFANILLKGTAFGTSTDSTGSFLLADIPPGQYELIASMIGFQQITRKINLKYGEKLHVGNIILEENALGLQEVVVTGTMKGTYISDSPIKIDVITAKQLDTYLPTASSSIVESIQLLNGVQEVVACGICYTNSISINGLPGAYTAVLMDGTPIYGNLAAVYGLNGIPNMIIDRFEVIKGPSSTLYGSEAVAGVINIITKDPAKQPLLSLDIMGTSHLESFGNVAIAPKLGKVNGYIGLNYAYINDFDDFNNDNFGDQINLDRYSFFTKWNLDRKSNKKLTLTGKYYYEDRRNGVEEFLKNRNYKKLRGSDLIYGESIYTNRAELFGTYEFNTKANLRVDYSLSHHIQDSYYGSDYYKAEQNIAFANIIWNKISGKHDILAGATTRYQYYDDNTFATQSPDYQFIPGVFLQDEWTLNPHFTLLGGARLDHYDAHGIIFAPRLNIKYKPSTWTTLRTNFGTGFRVVNLFTEDHAFVTGQRTVEIIGDLQPERSYNISFNFNHIFTLGESQGSIDLESYYTYFTNKIIPDYDTPGKIIYANSEGHAETMGIGVNINQNFTFPLNINLGVNIQRVTQTEPDESNTLKTSNIEYAPEWSSVFTANYRWKKPQITLAYTLRLTGPMALPLVYDLDAQGNPLPQPRPTRSEPFAFQNLQISKDFSKQFNLYIGIQNLFNYRQQFSPLVGFNDPTTPPGFSQYFDTAYAFSPLHGREFYTGIKWNITKGKN
ncbi:MAG: TonB-dependent receptor [Saprospiraceae bacterium]